MDPATLARELARGQRPERLLAGLAPEVRDCVAGVIRACGEELLHSDEEVRQLKESQLDLELAVRSYSSLKHELRAENEDLRAAAAARQPRTAIIGAAGGLGEVFRLIEKVADTRLAILISGETGTGKEVIARYIHERGARAGKPFVAINCGGVPEALLESELFGIEKGVATGVNERAGKFQQAHGGTLFLDEVADMTAAMQVKVLRALQEHEIERVGGRRAIAVDARIVAASNRDLRGEVEAKRFREDLYYRLANVHVHLPPLRERAEDIDALVDHFIELGARQMNRRPPAITPEARQALRGYRWPGNVRELAAEVQRAVAVADGARIDVGDLTPGTAAATRKEPQGRAGAVAALVGDKIVDWREFRRLFERAYLEHVLARAEGSCSRAAVLLGLSYEGLRKKLESLGMGARSKQRGRPQAS
jgi:DNA-binding NtrC family response regulator